LPHEKNAFVRDHFVVAFVLFAFVPVALFAQSTHATSSNSVDQSQAPPATQLKSRVLVKSVISFDTPNEGVALTASPQALDPATTITCPNMPATCTIVVDINVQYGFGASSGPVSLCFLVDGVVTNAGSCPDVGFLPTSNWTSTTFSMVATAGKGTHGVQTEIWPSATASRGYYTITYRVYKP
jgi:hypothetical protein